VSPDDFLENLIQTHPDFWLLQTISFLRLPFTFRSYVQFDDPLVVEVGVRS
jgi:hypothetical protein